MAGGRREVISPQKSGLYSYEQIVIMETDETKRFSKEQRNETENITAW